MQEIFFGGIVNTNCETEYVANSMMINDGSVFFVGEKEEVLNLKTQETKVYDLKNDYIYPCLFDVYANIFNKIDNKLKTQKKIKKFQFSDDIDENYENFEYFDLYKNEYLKLEKEYIKNGIATIFDLNIDKRAFAFWKKMSEEKLLTIDVVGYVDIINAKQVMDDNCVTYRKYRNHFRLGGYNIRIDGKIQELKAWLNKPYSGTRACFGMAEFYGEHLYYILKMVLEEKKQMFFEVNGDKALGEVLTVLEEIKEKENLSEFYRPIFFGSSVLNQKLINKVKGFDGTFIFEKFDNNETKKIKNFLGFLRARNYHNYKKLVKAGVRFIVLNRSYELQNFSANLSLWLNNRKVIKNFQSKQDYKNKFADFVGKMIYKNPAYISFDQDSKGTIETQMRSDFVIVKDEIFNNFKDVEKSIKSVYISGEKKY